MFLVLLAVVAVAALWLVSTYNGLVGMRQRAGQAFSDIGVQLKQRHDLVPNLVETVKGYATHEKSTLDEVVKARNLALSAQGPAAQASAEAALGGALSRLIAIAESLSRPQGQRQFPGAAVGALRPREQDRRLAALLQQRRVRIQRGLARAFLAC